jgi:hypothetical protein
MRSLINMMDSFLSIKAFFVCSLFVLISASSLAAKKYSTGNGNWTATGTWVGGVVPVTGDTVIIQTNHTVSVSANLYGNSTYMFLIILGTLDLTNNGKLSFDADTKIIIETGARILGNGNSDQISIGSGSPEYTGGQGTITGPSYVSNGHTPSSGEGTGGCGCYTSVGNCTVSSTNGYNVHINVWATQIVVNTSPCTSGYNYDVRLNYNVTFSGTNIPANLDVLQGNVFCGSQATFFSLPTSGGSGSVTTVGNQYRNANDCATATPQSLGCLNTTLQVAGPGIAPNTSCSASLPIELIKFEVAPVLQGAKLNWATSMEKNFHYFQIERAGKDLNFLPIGQIESKGGLDINISYDYLDEDVKAGKNYYRLKSVDYDGSYEYSNVVHLNWSNGGGVKVYPNPTADKSLNIELNDYMSTPTKIRLLDQLGHIVYQSELTEPSTEIQLPRSIQPGFYHLRLLSEQRQEQVKVVIQ